MQHLRSFHRRPRALATTIPSLSPSAGTTKATRPTRVRTGLVLSLWATAVLCLAACPDGGDPIPQPDICSEPDVAGIAAVDIGQGNVPGVFEPWQEQTVTPLIFGPQGGAMLAMRIRVSGQETSCIEQHTRLIDPLGQLLMDDGQALRVYPESDKSYLTDSHFLLLFEFFPPDPGTFFTMETTVGQTTVSRSLWLDSVYTGPALTELSPASTELPAGQEVDLSIMVSEPISEYRAIRVASSAPAIVTIDQPWVTLEPGMRTTTVTAHAMSAGGPVTLSAALGDQVREATIVVTP